MNVATEMKIDTRRQPFEQSRLTRQHCAWFPVKPRGRVLPFVGKVYHLARLTWCLAGGSLRSVNILRSDNVIVTVNSYDIESVHRSKFVLTLGVCV